MVRIAALQMTSGTEPRPNLDALEAQGFYRFAAADGASAAFRPKAISYVMAAGLACSLAAFKAGCGFAAATNVVHPR